MQILIQIQTSQEGQRGLAIQSINDTPGIRGGSRLEVSGGPE